jgi:hypothetical protein
MLDIRVTEVDKTENPDSCPNCGDESEITFILGIASGRLSVCSGCGLLKVDVFGEEGDYLKETRYWYSPVAATTDDWDQEDDEQPRVGPQNGTAEGCNVLPYVVADGKANGPHPQPHEIGQVPPEAGRVCNKCPG